MSGPSRAWVPAAVALLLVAGCGEFRNEDKPLPIEARESNGTTPYRGPQDERLGDEQVTTLRERSAMQR